MGNFWSLLTKWSLEDKQELQGFVDNLNRQKNKDGSITVSAEEWNVVEKNVKSLFSPTCASGYEDIPVYQEPVRLLHQLESNATNKFMEELQKITNGRRLTVDEFYSFKYENFPRTLIVCDMKSRIDDNLKSELDSLDCRFFPKCILIGLYIRDQHDLPTKSTASGSSALEYNFENIIDIVFHPDRGIYDCDWNRVARNKLQPFTAFDRKTAKSKHLTKKEKQ